MTKNVPFELKCAFDEQKCSVPMFWTLCWLEPLQCQNKGNIRFGMQAQNIHYMTLINTTGRFQSKCSSMQFVVPLISASTHSSVCLRRWVCGSRTCPCSVSSGPFTSPSRSTKAAARTSPLCLVPMARTGWRMAISMKMRNITLNPVWRQPKRQMEMTRLLKTGHPRTAGYMTRSISQYKTLDCFFWFFFFDENKLCHNLVCWHLVSQQTLSIGNINEDYYLLYNIQHSIFFFSWFNQHWKFYTIIFIRGEAYHFIMMFTVNHVWASVGGFIAVGLALHPSGFIKVLFLAEQSLAGC